MTSNTPAEAVSQSRAGEVRLTAVGDIMLGDFPACFGFGVKSQIAQNGPDFIWQKIRERWAGTDILIGNLEAVLSDLGARRLWMPSLYMRGPSEGAAALRRAGFTLLSVANNHMMQHGSQAFRDTVQRLHGAGIQTVGVDDPSCGESIPAVQTVNGVGVGFLGFSMRPEEYRPGKALYSLADEASIVTAIRRLKDRVDVIVLSVHWGDEYMTRPSAAQVRMARRFVDEGVSLIIGHHPHVLQGIERYKKAVIAYSLGNFVFDMWMPVTRRTAILEVTLSQDGVGTFEAIPVRINNHFQPEIVSGSEREEQCAELQRLSSCISDCTCTDEYAFELRRQYQAYRQEVRKHYQRSAWKFNPFYLAQMVSLILLRRFSKLHI